MSSKTKPQSCDLKENGCTLLLVDDDKEICQLLANLLSQKYGYHLLTAHHPKEIVPLLEKNKVDLVLLDIMLPGEDGLTVCRKLRTQWENLPIIMLTANSEQTDRIVGLEVGADDYITKPFDPRELVARIRAVLRRVQSSDTTKTSQSKRKRIGMEVYYFSGWRLDVPAHRLISPKEVSITLSAGEYALLFLFINNPGRVLSRDQLLELLHNRESTPFDRSIDIQVSRLRQKLSEDPKKPNMIKTIRGGGYLFSSEIEVIPKVNE